VVAGDLGESDLDIEVISAIARNAEIIFVTSPASSGGVDQSAAWAIDQNPPAAPVISYSYGLCEAFVLAPNISTAEGTYQKAAGEGISFFAATGDSGAAECDGDAPPNGNYPAILGLSVSYPASSQYVTGVGGTEFNEGSGSYWNASNTIPGDGGSAKSYIPEIAWNDSVLTASLDATGGGPSNCATGTGYATEPGTGIYDFETCNAPPPATPPNGGFPKPTWQSGITPSDGVRDVPDIAFSASNANDPYIVCTPQSELVKNGVSTSTCANGIDKALTSFKYPSAFGGTSASTPVAAGMTVLLNQFLAASGGLGSINKQLYTVIYKNNPSVFHDITSGSSAYGTSDNMVLCTAKDPTFEPSALRCPSGGKMGYSAGSGYDLVSGLGSLDINAFFQAWQATEINFTTTATALSPASISAGNYATSTVTINPQNSISQSATYSFSCPVLPTGASCSFNPQTVTGNASTTMKVSTAPSMAPVSGAQVTVAGTSGGVSASAAPLSLTVTATTQSFSLQSQNPTYQVTQGNSVTVTVNLTPVNGFNAAVTYSCSEPATLTESTCMGPVGAISASTPASFLITTTAATGKLQRPFERTRIFYAVLLPGLLGIVFTFGSSRRSRSGMRMLGMIMVLGFSTLWLGSCSGSNGGNNSNPGTPKGSYTITINATTGGADPVTAQPPATFTLQVQ
jgi:subtilase family serine protease